MKNQKIIIILLVIILVVVLFPYLAIGAAFSSSSYQMRKHPLPTQTARPRVTAQDVAEMIRGNCETVYGDNVETELDEDAGLFTVRIWNADVNAETIERTAAGENLGIWENLVYNYTDSANTMQRAFTDHGIDDVTVVLSVCDPEDHGTAYFTIANGIVGYDVVRGIDLRAQGSD